MRPAVTVVVVLGLAAGVVTTAVDVVAAYLWRPLPYPAADRLVLADYPRDGGPSLRDLERSDWSSAREFAESIVASDIDAFTVLGGDRPFSVDGQWMNADVFALFGMAPAAGRFFTAEEAQGGERLAVIGYRVWRDHFAGSASAIGRTITARATLRQGSVETFTIVGVLPQSFWHLEDRTGLILPLNAARPPTVLRLRRGITVESAAARLTSIVRAQARVPATWTVVVRPAQEAHVAAIRPMLAATGWAVALLAFVTFVNLAFLQLARGVGRQREIAVRSVLGASNRTIAAQLLKEGLVAGFLASVLAVFLSAILSRVVASAIEASLGRLVPGGSHTLGSDPLLFAASMVATLAAGVALAAIMFVATQTAALPDALAGHPSSTDTRARAVARQLITASQAGVAFVLLLLAALMVRTSWHLARMDLGFDPRNVLSANVTLHEGTYRTLEQRRQFFATLLDRLTALPDVAHAGLTGWLPFRIGPATWVEPEGATGVSVRSSMQAVTAGYFHAMQIALVEGRLITREDQVPRASVAVVSRSLARSVWGEGRALGQRLRVRFNNSDRSRPGFGPFTVVGVVDDVLQSVTQATPPQLYTSFDQSPLASNAFLHLKTTRPPLEVAPAVARVVREADPTVPIDQAASLESIVEAAGLRPRVLARVLAAFALIAVGIAFVGLYAVSAWIANQRQREAALRVALGAEREAVALLLVRRGLVAVVAGLAAGWLAATPLALLLSAELRGVAASDVPTRVAISVVLVTLSTIALWRPAWRAATANLLSLLRVTS